MPTRQGMPAVSVVEFADRGEQSLDAEVFHDREVERADLGDPVSEISAASMMSSRQKRCRPIGGLMRDLLGTPASR